MSFFDDNFYKELDKDIDASSVNDTFNGIADEDEMDDNFNESEHFLDHMNLNVNKKNEETFNNLMDNASFKKDDYWDFNNPVIKIFLLILLVIIVIGLIYYIVSWFEMIG